MADWFGYNFPFFGQTFVLPPQADARLIKNDLKQLLLTSMGERVMRSNYGTILRKVPFDPGDDATLSELRSSIVTAVNQFEPRVALTDVRFNLDEDNNYLEIIVLAALTRDPNVTLDVRINVAPGDVSQSLRGI